LAVLGGFEAPVEKGWQGSGVEPWERTNSRRRPDWSARTLAVGIAAERTAERNRLAPVREHREHSPPANLERRERNRRMEERASGVCTDLKGYRELDFYELSTTASPDAKLSPRADQSENGSKNKSRVTLPRSSTRPSRAEENRLIRLAQSGDHDARNKIIAAIQPLVAFLAKPYADYANVQVEELISAVNVTNGITNAINKFDPGKGYSFAT